MRKWVIAAMVLAGLFAGVPSHAEAASSTKTSNGHVHGKKTHAGKHGKKGHHKGHKAHKRKGHKKSSGTSTTA